MNRKTAKAIRKVVKSMLSQNSSNLSKETIYVETERNRKYQVDDKGNKRMIAPGTIKLSPACARAVIKELKKSA